MSCAIVGSAADKQLEMCQRFSADFDPCFGEQKFGISQSALDGERPLNGLRHLKDQDTCGWFIWGGLELSTGPDFFKSLHVKHVKETCPAVFPFLALPPGWRFLISDDHEDVWFDAALLNTNE